MRSFPMLVMTDSPTGEESAPEVETAIGFHRSFPVPSLQPDVARLADRRLGRPQSVGALMLEVIVRVRTMLGKHSDIRWQNLIRHLDGNCYGFLTAFIYAYLQVALSRIRVDRPQGRPQ